MGLTGHYNHFLDAVVKKAIPIDFSLKPGPRDIKYPPMPEGIPARRAPRVWGAAAWKETQGATAGRHRRRPPAERRAPSALRLYELQNQQARHGVEMEGIGPCPPGHRLTPTESRP